MESTIVPRFKIKPPLHQKFYYLRKQLLLDSVSYQNVAKSSQRSAIRHLIAGFYSAKVRKGTAVDYLCNRCHIGEIIQILYKIDSQHPFQIVGLVAALSFVVVRLDNAYPFLPWYDGLNVRTCDNSSLRTDRLCCLSISIVFHFLRLFPLSGIALNVICDIEEFDLMLMEKYPDRIQNKYSQTKKRTYPMNVCEHCGNGQGWYYIYKDANEKIQGMKEIDVFTE